MKSGRVAVEKEFNCRSLTIQVRYCGGCNPDINRKAVVKRLKDLAESEGSVIRFTGMAEPADVLILVNGCAHACLEEEAAGEIASWYVSVQGEHVDCRSVAEHSLAEVVWQKISQKFREKRRDDDKYINIF
jgi:hypothetical protein